VIVSILLSHPIFKRENVAVKPFFRIGRAKAGEIAGKEDGKKEDCCRMMFEAVEQDGNSGRLQGGTEETEAGGRENAALIVESMYRLIDWQIEVAWSDMPNAPQHTVKQGSTAEPGTAK
jgi:hypothetical protein